MRLLIVEDDLPLQKLLAKVLSSNAFAVDSTAYGNKAKRLAVENQYDLILLDLILPDTDGVDVCSALRAGEIESPILMMSVRDSVEHKVHGLNHGADDYLPKPFAMDELLARIRTLIRRHPVGYSNPVLTIGPLTLDQNTRKARAYSRSLHLTAREFMILEYLMRRVGNIVTREELVDHVWDQSFDSFSNVIDVFMYYLRKKLLKAGVTKGFIRTVHGVGYKIPHYKDCGPDRTRTYDLSHVKRML